MKIVAQIQNLICRALRKSYSKHSIEGVMQVKETMQWSTPLAGDMIRPFTEI